MGISKPHDMLNALRQHPRLARAELIETAYAAEQPLQQTRTDKSPAQLVNANTNARRLSRAFNAEPPEIRKLSGIYPTLLSAGKA